MATEHPEQLGKAYEDAFNACHIDNIVALYEPDAVLVPSPGVRAVGLAAIREAQLAAIAMGGKFCMKLAYCLRVGDIAMLQHEWSWKKALWQGARTTFTSRTAEVARRGADGRWRYIVDHVWQND
jgi:ketosteroid isomerase-like protein